MLDDVDRRILRQLQADPALAVPDLAERVALTPSRLSRRLEKLEGAGVLKGQQAVID